LRYGRKIDVFPPRMENTAAGSGVSTGEFGEKGMVGGIKHVTTHVKQP
jgi:hypothetical protein